MNSIVPSIASMRLTWPSTTLLHVGESESSKSAMKPRAPEFSALMTILRSTGPVISTRRSLQVGGRAARPASRPRGSSRGLGQEVERLAGGDPGAALRARVEQLAPARLEALVERAEEGERVVGEDAGGGGGGEDVDGHGFLPWIEAASSSIG